MHSGERRLSLVPGFRENVGNMLFALSYRAVVQAGRDLKGMQIYVLRIYRQDARKLGGILEDAQTGRAVTFRTIRELTDLLRTTSVQAARKRRRLVQAVATAGKHPHKGEKDK